MTRMKFVPPQGNPFSIDDFRPQASNGVSDTEKAFLEMLQADVDSTGESRAGELYQSAQDLLKRIF